MPCSVSPLAVRAERSVGVVGLADLPGHQVALSLEEARQRGALVAEVRGLGDPAADTVDGAAPVGDADVSHRRRSRRRSTRQRIEGPGPDEGLPVVPPVANIEKRRRTRSLPHDGHSRAVASEPAPMGRRSSKGCSQARQRYS